MWPMCIERASSKWLSSVVQSIYREKTTLRPCSPAISRACGWNIYVNRLMSLQRPCGPRTCTCTSMQTDDVPRLMMYLDSRDIHGRHEDIQRRRRFCCSHIRTFTQQNSLFACISILSSDKGKGQRRRLRFSTIAACSIKGSWCKKPSIHPFTRHTLQYNMTVEPDTQGTLVHWQWPTCK